MSARMSSVESAMRRGAREVLRELEVHSLEMQEASLSDNSKEWAEACAYFNQWAWLRLKTGRWGNRVKASKDGAK